MQSKNTKLKKVLNAAPFITTVVYYVSASIYYADLNISNWPLKAIDFFLLTSFLGGFIVQLINIYILED